MANKDIAQSVASNLAGNVKDFSIDTLNTDAATGQKETTWQNFDWPKYWGYFNAVPDLKSAILMKAIWNVGKGFTADPATEVLLSHINGWGKDTFEDILFNMEVIRRVNGDAYAEIIRDSAGALVNLKPLDPGSMRIIVDEKGMIVRYEQMNKINDAKKEFPPDKIFHLSHNRLADQIHGISDIKALEKTILAEEQSFDDAMKIMHRQAKPMIMFKLGTDNAGKIATFVNKMDKATATGENIYIPDDENAVKHEIIQVDISAQFLLWRTDVRNKFYRGVGMPLIVFGNAGTTESGGKIEYLAHEQVFEHEQKFIEEQIWQQLGITIDLYSPVSLLESLQGDQTKDTGQPGLQPADVTATATGR